MAPSSAEVEENQKRTLRMKKKKEKKNYVIALYDCEGNPAQNAISFKKGDIFELVAVHDSWCSVKKDNLQGYGENKKFMRALFFGITLLKFKKKSSQDIRPDDRYKTKHSTKEQGCKDVHVCRKSRRL